MLYVSLIVEALRARPRLMFWAATLAQALLWTLVPALFYAAPPGDLPIVLAVGHEYQVGTDLGPPLAFWLADVAFNLAGGSMVGVYLLSQVCVVAAFWGIFALGRATVGIFQAVLAVLLMVGVAVLSVPTPEFGPAILAMPIWTLVLLHYWEAVGRGRTAYLFPLSIEIGLLLLSSYVGLALLALLAVFTVATARGRAALGSIDSWLAGTVAVLLAMPYLAWLANAQDVWMPMLARLRRIDVDSNIFEWLRILGEIAAAHAGIVVLVVLAAGWPSPRREKVATVDRPPMDPWARTMIYFFVLVPLLTVTLAAVLFGQTPGWQTLDGQVWSLASSGPLVICSGLAVIVAAGESIRLCRQRLLSFAWIGLLVGPPAIMVVAIAVLPWTLAVDLKVLQPADEMGRFFAESFERRTGKPLAIVTGEPRTAALVALEARSRPSLLVNASLAQSPWVHPDDVREKGAVVVWPATDRPGTPPPSVTARFPDLVIEVPRAFERPIQGRLQLLRIGWAVIRPQGDQPAAPPAAPVAPR